MASATAAARMQRTLASICMHKSLLLRKCIPRPFARQLSTSSALLSGHNKWSKIKARKGANDAQKSAIYGRAYRDIMIAARQGGSADPELNTTLAAAIKRSRAQGVPKDNVDNALKKAAGVKDSGDQPITYEVMAGTVGIVIECLSNNANRTATRVREKLNRHGARLTPVMFLFERKGCVRVSLDDSPDLDNQLEHLVDKAFEAGAEDFEQDEPSEGVVEIEFKCDPGSIRKLTTAVTASGMTKELLGSELVYTPTEKTDSQDEVLQTKVSDLVDSLEELEDTLRVWTTLDS